MSKYRLAGGKKVLVVTHGGVTTYRLNEAKGRLELEDYNRTY